MPPLDLRPRSASELVDAGFRLLRRHYGAFVTLAAIATVPSLLIQLLGLGVLAAGESVTTRTVVLYLLAVPYYALTEGAQIALASDAYLTGEASVAGAVRRALPRVLFAATSLLLVGAAAFLGLLLLIVPGIYIMLRSYTTLASVVLDRVGPADAMRRTWARTRGRAGHVLATVGLTFLLFLVLLLGAGMLAGIMTVASEWVALGLSTLLTVLVYPMVPIVSTLLYYDLRIRSEGYDLEVLSGQLDGAPLGAGAVGH